MTRNEEHQKRQEAPRRTVSLIRIFLAGSIALTAVSLGIISYSWVASERKHFNEESRRLRDEYIASRKTMLRNEVRKVIDYINYMRNTTEDRLKNTIVSQIHQASAVAESVYRQNKNRLSPDRLKNLVRETIRPIRFNNGRGYYFAVGMDGVEQLFADRPEMEGKNLLEMRDTNGKWVIRDMIALARKEREGFYTYTWTHPKLPGNHYQKISYIKYEPFLDWLLGTGEYLEDVEGDIQREVLQRIAKIRFDRNGYIFVVDFDDKMVINPMSPELVGKNIREIGEPDGAVLSNRQRTALNSANGVFIYYDWLKPRTGEIAPKMACVYAYHDWRWYIGAGVYMDEIDAIIHENDRRLREILRYQILKTIFFSLLILIGVSTAIWFFSRKLGREMESFIAFLKDAATGEGFLDPDRQSVREFRLLAESTNCMLDRRRSVEAELKESEARFRDLADLLPQTIFEVDLNGVFTFVNRHGFESFGYGDEDIRASLTIWDVVVAEQHDLLKENLTRVLRGEWSPGREYTGIGKTGKMFPVLTYTAPIIRGGVTVGIRGIVVDVSSLKKTQQELKQARDEAEAASFAKSQFLANMSHEIRTPLNGIIGFAEILNRKTEDAESREMLKLILDSGNVLMDLVNNILDLSRIEANRVDLEQIPLNPAFLADVVVRKYRVQAEAKGLKFLTRLDPLLPESVLGDPLRLEQILTNLISNAIKFTHKGEIVFTLQLSHINPESAGICFSVSDTGIGIPEEKQAVIFDKFTQTEDYITRQYGGAGLGLAIVKRLTVLMEGKISVQSVQGEGSLFTVAIPFLLPRRAQVLAPLEDRLNGDAEEAGAEETVLNRTLHILVAEDNTINQKLILRLIRQRGWTADLAADGEEAVEKFSAGRYDLVLMDIQMPHSNGMEATERIRRLEWGLTRRVPVIALTAFAMKGDREKCLEAGMDDYIPKPIIAQQFYQTIRRVLEGKKEE